MCKHSGVDITACFSGMQKCRRNIFAWTRAPFSSFQIGADKKLMQNLYGQSKHLDSAPFGNPLVWFVHSPFLRPFVTLVIIVLLLLLLPVFHFSLDHNIPKSFLESTHSVSIQANTGTYYDSIYTNAHTHTYTHASLLPFILSKGSLAFFQHFPSGTSQRLRPYLDLNTDSFMCSGVSNVSPRQETKMIKNVLINQTATSADKLGTGCFWLMWLRSVVILREEWNKLNLKANQMKSDSQSS